MTAADLDGDGHVDIVGTNRLSDDISIRFSDASGAFGPEMRVVAGDGPSAVALGDLDGDGLLDLVAVNRGSDDMTIFRQSPARVFAQPGPTQTGDAPEDLALGDLDRDGFLDIAVASAGSNTVRVFFGNGTPMPAFGVDLPAGFAPARVFIEPDGPLAVVAGNPLGELVVVSRGSNDVRIFSQTAPRVFVQPFPPAATGSRPESMAVADLDGDGLLDVVTGGNGFLHVHFRQGGGSWFDRDLTALAGSGGAPADIDGDSDLDLFVPDGWLEAPALPRTGMWTFHAIDDSNPGDGPALVGVDLNDDGRPDLVTAPQHVAGSLAWFENPPDPIEDLWIRRGIDDQMGSHHLLAADFQIERLSFVRDPRRVLPSKPLAPKVAYLTDRFHLRVREWGLSVTA
ncbi:MAG: VCBS repeat-containing protein, partial [Chloroflexi bacterium]|nr:VCBS repeat-containing protein [Chloroflexota bacterium]